MFRPRGQQGQQQPQAQTIKPKRGKLLGRGKGTGASTGYRRLSPLKENSPSKPKQPPPPPTQQTMMPRKGAHGKNLPRNDNSRQSSNSTLASSNTPPTGFSQAELFELQESFKLFDIENNGSIQVGDLTSILKTLQEEQQQSNSQRVFPHLDTLLQRLARNYHDEDTLSLEDYIDLMASTTISSAMASAAQDGAENDYDDERKNFAHVFHLFDLDGKGYITVQDLERVAAELGEHDMTREELEDMIQRAKAAAPSPQRKHGKQSGSKRSPQHEQRVSIDEFTRVMTMNLFPRGPTEQQA